MLFETTGWALPTKIAAQSKTDGLKKDNTDKTVDSSEATKAADKLQAQLVQLNKTEENQTKNKKSKNSKKNKKRSLEEIAEEQPTQNKKQKQAVEKSQNKDTNKKPVQQPAQKVNQKANQKPTQKTNQPKNSIQKSAELATVNTTEVSKKEQQKKKLKELLSKKAAPNNNSAIKTNQDQKEKKKEKKAPEEPKSKSTPTPTPTVDDGLTPLQRKMKEKLSGARFRWLNEQLYTTPGNKSFSLFQEKPELFDEYHEGFRHQVESWPVNPVDVIISQLKKMPKNTVIADLGCGDAMIAQSLTKQTVLSFDLVAKNDFVTACDISKLPLEANSVDVAVFSLSLMGTNYIEFLKEAHRVLKIGGELKIAEVISRFSDLDTFIALLESLGFDFMDKDDDNKMFVMLYFTKQPNFEEEIDHEMLAGLSKTQIRSLKKGAGINNSNSKLQKKAQQLLKPCLYKKR